MFWYDKQTRVDLLGEMEEIPKEFETEVNSPCYHAIARRLELQLTWRLTQKSGAPVAITGIHVVREKDGDVEVITYDPPLKLELHQRHAIEHLLPWWDALDLYAQGTVDGQRWHVKKSHLEKLKKEWRRRENDVKEHNWRDERRCGLERLIGGPLPVEYDTVNWDELSDSAKAEIDALAKKYGSENINR